MSSGSGSLGPGVQRTKPVVSRENKRNIDSVFLPFPSFASFLLLSLLPFPPSVLLPPSLSPNSSPFLLPLSSWNQRQRLRSTPGPERRSLARLGLWPRPGVCLVNGSGPQIGRSGALTRADRSRAEGHRAKGLYFPQGKCGLLSLHQTHALPAPATRATT